MTINDYLSPERINSVSDLELLAKLIAENATLGINKSLRTGFGQEFSQYRSYEPGDDLRYLDWKLFARNDRYYIRQSEIESNITVRFILDCSASMDHEFNGLKKIDFIKVLVASFAYIAYNQHDRIALHAIKDNHIESFEFSGEKPVFHHFLNHLVHINTGKNFRLSEKALLKEIHATRKELIIFVSDMYEEKNEINSLLAQIHKLKEEVILFHILAENELDLSLLKSDNLEDLESGQIFRKTNTQAYNERLQQFIEETERNTIAMEATYQLFSSFSNIDEVIRTFIKRRERMS